MKVLFVTRKYPPQVGGMENFSYNLIQHIQCHKKVIALKRSNKHLVWFFPYALLYCLFNARKYDIIHLGDMVLSGFAYVIKIFYPKKLVIVSVHGLDVTYDLKFYQWYLRKFGHKCNSYVCNSKNTEKLAKQVGIKDTTVIPLGVDINKFEKVEPDKQSFKKRYGIPEENIVMLTTGRLVRRKGVLWFVDNVMPYYKSRNVTYLVVGQGEDSRAIDEAIEKHGLDKQVKLLGRVTDEELKGIYINSDIFIMPNIVVKNDVEGFGLVALEAALSNNIVIGSNIEGISDAISQGENGILVNSKATNEYISRINDVIDKKEEYSKFAIKASHFTRKNYSWKRVAELYLEHFKYFI